MKTYVFKLACPIPENRGNDDNNSIFHYLVQNNLELKSEQTYQWNQMNNYFFSSVLNFMV
jgi:hypothetical protein